MSVERGGSVVVGRDGCPLETALLGGLGDCVLSSAGGGGRRRRRLAGSVVIALVVLCVGVSSAGARVVHLREGTFTGGDSPGGAFGAALSSDAADVASGDVWVAEDNFFEGKFRVDKFTGAGVYAGVEITGGESPFVFGVLNSGVAVDNTVSGVNKGDLYVADTGNHVVDRFGEGGELICQIAGGETEAETPLAKECGGVKGSELSEAITPAGLAVDSAGNVFVADDAHEAIDEFGPGGKFVGQIKDSHLSNEMTMLAVDPSGGLYVVNGMFLERRPDVLKFEAGHFASVFDSNSSVGVGVDPSTGHVYVSDQSAGGESELAEYEPSGALLDVTLTPGASFGGIAVGVAGRVYGAEAFAFFSPTATEIFSGDMVVPNVVTLPASGVSETSATLHGEADPDSADGGGEVTACRFEYGTSTSYGSTVACSPGPPYSGIEAVSANVSLSRSTTYHYRVEAQNANGVASQGQDETLTTSGPAVIDGELTRVIGTGATVHAQITPFGFDTTCRLQYVLDASFQVSKYAGATTVPCAPEDLGGGFGDQSASVSINGLQAGAVYHYRFVAENQAGLVGASDRTFSTFGANNVKFEVLDKEGGSPVTQAGGRPGVLQTSFKINVSEAGVPGVDGNVKDVLTRLPAGLIGGTPTATRTCTRRQLSLFECPGVDQVGVISVDLEGEEKVEKEYPIYNLLPPKGVAAEFGANILSEVNIYIDGRVRTGEDYSVVGESANSTAIAGLTEAFVTLWGVPADESHDKERFCGHPAGGALEAECKLKAGERVLKPFLRNPTSCVGPLSAVFSVDSWQAPGAFAETVLPMPAVTGCGEVPFTPTFTVRPTTSVADSPTGLEVDVHNPQNQEPEGPGEGDLKSARVVLPVGVSINPSAANGLQACTPSQVGLTSGPGVTPVTFTADAATCPNAAKVGTVEVDTPLLDHPLLGGVYVASPYQNPFGSLLAVYIAVDDQQSGIVIKLPGRVQADPNTGQLTSTFDENPQLPFEDFKLQFFHGPRASLATPGGCGAFTTTNSLLPWSGNPAVSSSESFGISSGCESGFAPAFTAGSTSLQAGGFTPFTVSLARSDADQNFAGLSITLPPGLSARLAGVPLCPEPAIAAAEQNSGAAEKASSSCPASSQIGTVIAGSGTGPEPVFLSGKAYLTGPYKGGPYGVAIIVPAVTGPYDLGTVVVRESLQINPNTAQVTDVSDPFPTILKGIPIRLRQAEVKIERPGGFATNPTNCNATTTTAAVSSTGGQSAQLSSRFQVSGCAGLPFNPKLMATTHAKYSKANGAFFDVKVTQNPGEANISKVAVALPLALPSRLKTLQKACLAAQFQANPAGCPMASRVGKAVAHTPVLADPLIGTAYLVSHGGGAFPDLVTVLQGEGITIDLTGHTDIKHGITYSRFETVPDQPISSFELTLPQGPFSALAGFLPAKAKGSFCSAGLLMPTTITGQNGRQVSHETKIGVQGCPKKPAKHKKRAGKRKKK